MMLELDDVEQTSLVGRDRGGGGEGARRSIPTCTHSSKILVLVSSGDTHMSEF